MTGVIHRRQIDSAGRHGAGGRSRATDIAHLHADRAATAVLRWVGTGGAIAHGAQRLLVIDQRSIAAQAQPTRALLLAVFNPPAASRPCLTNTTPEVHTSPIIPSHHP